MAVANRIRITIVPCRRCLKPSTLCRHRSWSLQADSDPLLAPPPYGEFTNPNAHDHSYIESPSYADAIFNPFDGDNVDEINGVGSPNSSSNSSLGLSRLPSSVF